MTNKPNHAVRGKIFKTFRLVLPIAEGPFMIPGEVDLILYRLRYLGWHLHTIYALSTSEHHTVHLTMWTEDDNEKALNVD